MTPDHYKIWHAPANAKPYPVKIEYDRQMALLSLDMLRRKSREAGTYYIQPIYPVQEMKTEQLDKFVALCDNVIQLQNAYYASRTTENLKASIIEETKLDNYIAAVKRRLAEMPDYQPNPKAKQFFDLVAQWRTAFKDYHAYRKKQDPTPELVREKKKYADGLRSIMADIVRQYKAATNVRNK